MSEVEEYEVTLVHCCDIRDLIGCSVIEIPQQSIDGKVWATPGPTIFEPHSAGNLAPQKGLGELQLRVLEVPGQELMRLNRVRLK